ncbi:MAG: radical SAM protein [Caldilineales bacterium]
MTINRSPVSNTLAPIPHPDRLPGWPYHRVDVPRYIRNTFMGSRTMTHHSSYGCPFFCNFCAVVNMVNGRWLAHSAERVAADVQMFVDRWGVNAVEFDDNNFFTAEARVAEFSERLLAAGLEIGWWGEARIDTMMHYGDRTWELMRDSGLKMVFLGAESGSDETLQRMNKGGKASTEKTLEIARKMAAYDIVPEMSFVLGNPPDPEADTRQTIEFIRKVKQVNPATEIIMYMYTPVPLAGELYEQAKSTGFAFPETLEGWIDPSWQEFSQRRSVSMPWLNDPIRRQITNFQWVLNAYHPTTTDTGMSSLKRNTLRAASAWRYRLGFYDYPLELRALHKVMSYQRPETMGFRNRVSPEETRFLVRHASCAFDVLTVASRSRSMTARGRRPVASPARPATSSAVRAACWSCWTPIWRAGLADRRRWPLRAADAKRLIDPAAYPLLPDGPAVQGNHEWRLRRYDLAVITSLLAAAAQRQVGLRRMEWLAQQPAGRTRPRSDRHRLFRGRVRRVAGALVLRQPLAGRADEPGRPGRAGSVVRCRGGKPLCSSTPIRRPLPKR